MGTPSRTHPASLSDEALLAACRMTKGRTSGPGGQHRNKVETLVELTHGPTGIAAHAGERRTVRENLREALRRLRLALAMGRREGVPLGDARSSLWRSRCRDGKIVCSPGHRDFAAMLAEALDMIEACGGDMHRASLRLDCTQSQLVKLLRDHPPALAAVNTRRAERGERRLK